MLIAAGQNGNLASLNTAELYDWGAGSFSGTGSVAVARYLHTSTILPNGKVLIAGGVTNPIVPSASAELYDPASGTFTASGSLATARYFHTATLLADGRVLITGGCSDSACGPVTSAEIYDPIAGTFSAAASMTTVRYGSTATLLPNGKVLIAAGSNGSVYLASAELYDPVAGTFSATSNLASARFAHTATLLPNGKVLIVAGSDNSARLLTAELYDPVAGTFSVTGSMAIARDYSTATLLPNGKVLVAGGASDTFVRPHEAELFNPATGTFSTTGNLATGRDRHTATLLGNGQVLLSGGVDADPTAGFTFVNSAELYDPAAGTFSATGSLAGARGHHTATLLLNGKVLVASGTIPNLRIATAELYDVGLGFADARRPVVASAPTTVVEPGEIELTGTGFRGDSESSGGTGTGSHTNYPLLHLQRVDNDQTLFVQGAWSETSFSSYTFDNLAPGHYRVSVVTNGIPSVQHLVLITDFGAPAFFSATLFGSAVELDWSAVGAASSYDIFRSTSLTGPYSFVKNSAGTSTSDSSIAPNITYLYKVRAVKSGVVSAFSTIDPATTITFTDPNLIGAPMIRRVHITELRTAVQAMRVAAELPPATFANEPLAAGTPVLRLHLIQLRTAVNEALAALGLPPFGYTDAIVTAGSTMIKKAHITELRNRTR